MGQKELWFRVPMAGVTIRCTQLVAVRGEYVFGCGWVGDSGDATLDPAGAERCPECGGSTVPPPQRPPSARR